ncbi:hypothetical protein INT46_010558 [Mucor plumbeus]|uniref:Cas12f1-like TNB domain-containing protein n=1 Tax=Mucor plumbeus TaxID=97098 RepID=A0A8H7QG81_9FUNG|nr:hypothetical protein INT46_010558 [Mucor plumbeus]
MPPTVKPNNSPLTLNLLLTSSSCNDAQEKQDLNYSLSPFILQNSSENETEQSYHAVQMASRNYCFAHDTYYILSWCPNWERPQPTCKDCKEIGHYNKKYYKCKLFKEGKADDVGTSKKQQTSAIKNAKREAKRQKVVADPNVRCTNCKGTGHKTSLPPDCPRYILSKLEVMNQNLGTGFQSFTRKFPFDTCVKERYRSVLKDRILSASEDVRQLLFRAQMFANYFIILHSNKNIPGCIYQQPFWYSICQLVNNRRITNSKVLPPGMLDGCNNFKRQYPTILYKVDLAIKTFEQRVFSYLCYLVQNIYMSMKPDQVKLIVKEYCYQYVCRGEPKWPAGVALSDDLKSRIRNGCDSLSNHTTESTSLKSLSASPVNYIRCFSYILLAYEEEHRSHSPFDVRRLPLARLFNISPKPSCRCRFVNVSVNALSCFVKESLPRGYENQLQTFYRVFDFTKLRFKDISQLRADGENTVLFNNLIRFDGFAVGFIFNRKKQESIIGGHDLTLEDFTYEEVEGVYRPVFIDPGRKAVFTAAVGLGDDHQVRRCSTKEYYDLTGSTKYSIKLQRLKDERGITPIETGMPTTKTCQATVYLTYTTYMLLHRLTLFDFYGFQRVIDRFFLYQGRQKAPQTMVNMLVNGSSNYDRKQRNRRRKKRKREFMRRQNKNKKKIHITNIAKRKWKPSKFRQDKTKVPLIVFGAGMFVTGIFWHALKNREKEGDLLVVTIDEFMTSRTCNLCHEDSLRKADGVKGHSVLGCQNCKTLWQRDINAAKNMLLISSLIWNGNGRPEIFSPKAKI